MSQAPKWKIEIIRSARRRKSVSAKVKGDVLQVRAPAKMPDRELEPIVDRLQQRLQRKWLRKNQAPADEKLEQMANRLNRQYFEGKLSWQSIRFVTNQQKRYGSCTPAKGTIRLSHRLATMPEWVLRYVLIHELAHLVEANHGAAFWKLVNQYPLTERARGYLMGVGLEEDRGAQ